ncbi:MAG: BatD family protein [Verrucomicrobiota bacterium]
MQQVAETIGLWGRTALFRGWFRAWLGLAVLLAGISLRAATFTATLDRDAIQVGENATLTLKFDDGKPKSMPALPSIANLQISPQGSFQNYTIDNGRSSSSYTYTYAVIPAQPGDYTIPTLGAIVDGKVLTSQPLKLKVVKAGATDTAGGGDQLAFLKLFVPKKEVYLGEICGVQLQLFIRDGVANAEGILQSFEQLANNSSPLKVEGCNILKTGYAQRRQVQAGNGNYTVATLVTAISPAKTGPITIDSINATLTLQLPTGGRRRDAFDPFGMFQQYDERRVPIAAEAQKITSLAVPKENAPANFNGAVGSFTLTVSAGPTNVATGDPITVKVQLTGRGALEALSLPDQPAWHDFKTYPPTAKIETTDPLGIQGTKIFEQVIVPQSADIHELPPISFSYFDSDKKAYQTLTQPAIPLVVRPGGVTVQPSVAAVGRPTQDAPPLTKDIVSIKQRFGAPASTAGPWLRQPVFLTMQGIPVLALVGAIVWRRRTDSFAANPRLRRQRQVAQTVRTGLSDLRKFAADKKSDDFFATLFHLLQEQLGERLNVPASSITEAVIEEQLEPRGVPAETLNALHELFQSHNLARYAPVTSGQELAALIPKLEAVLKGVQELKS